MTAVNWDSPLWGKPGTNVHQATEPGDWHTDEAVQP